VGGRSLIDGLGKRGGTVRVINWLFLSLLAVSVFTGCAPPIGYIAGGDSAGDKLLAVPYRMVYNVNDIFRRDSDVEVFASSGGVLQPIPVKDVKISVIEDPQEGEPVEVPSDEDYQLEYAGRKIIVIDYKGSEARYSIEVQDPKGVGGEYINPGSIQMGNGWIIWVY